MKKSISSLIFLISVILGCEQNEKRDLNIAPQFSLPDINDGMVSFDDYNADIVLLHFWADWCPHCRDEFDELQQVYDELKGQGFLIVGVNVGQTKDLVQGIVDRYRVDFPMLYDQDKSVSERYRVTGLPVSFFIDKQGKILKRKTGWLTVEEVKKAFRELI